MLLAVILAGCGKIDTATNWLVATNSPQAINNQGVASLTFNVYWAWLQAGNLPASGMTVNFKATNGSCTSSAVTDAKGNVTCVFTTNDPYSFEGATVTASMKRLSNNSEYSTEELSGGDITAEAVVLPLLRPSKSKVKPKLVRVGDPPVIEDGKTLFRVRLTEEGGDVSEQPLPGREVRFVTDESKGSCTEKAPTSQNDMAVAKCKFTQNSDGSLTGIAYFKKKDGTEGYFKMKATRKASWSD